MTTPDSPDFGPCCACGRADVPTTNILMLGVRAPIPATGWGCVVCGLSHDGALAVVCQACFASNAPARFAVYGFATNPEHQRVPIETLTEPFQHDTDAHAYDEAKRQHAARYARPLRIN